MADRIVAAAGADSTPPEWLAPADKPDPFEQQWWTLMQVLAWVYLGNRAVVRDASPPEPFKSTFTIMDLRDLGRNGACYPRIANAEEAVIEALRAGRLTASGVANGEGDRKEIPSLLWLDLEFRYEPYYFAGPSKDFSRTATYWNDLRFQRRGVLAIWPDPFEQPDDRPSAEEHPAGIPEEPGAPPVRVGDNVFKDMDGLAWAEITITFTEQDAVRIRARARSETFTFDAMGFKNRKSLLAEPNQCWKTFQCLAIVSTSDKTWNDVSPAVSPNTFKKRISELRGQLRLFFRITDDPIVYRKGVGYVAAFNLQADASAIQDERERRLADDDGEDYQQEMRQGYTDKFTTA